MWEWLVHNPELASALATFLAVVVALAIALGAAAVRWWNRPILTIDFANRPRWRRHSSIVNDPNQLSTVVGLSSAFA
jgi:hypothetical protein